MCLPHDSPAGQFLFKYFPVVKSMHILNDEHDSTLFGFDTSSYLARVHGPTCGPGAGPGVGPGVGVVGVGVTGVFAFLSGHL